jgi:diacylglycerol kinase (ATP)
MIPQIKARFGALGFDEIRTTERKGEESGLAQQAISDGFTTLVAVGGDGTTANIANAILHSGADVRLAAMPAGTVIEFAKVLGTAKSSVLSVAEICAIPSNVRVDVGRIEDVFFLNCCGFGFDVAVLEQIHRTTWLRGSSVYLYTAVRQLFGFPGFDVSIGAPGQSKSRDRHMLLVIANAAFFGGTFKIAPGASVVDGMLDAVSILDLSSLGRIGMLSAATRGAHGQRKECLMERASMFEVEFASAPSFETDGELHHANQSKLRVVSCPAALRVVAARGFPQ